MKVELTFSSLKIQLRSEAKNDWAHAVAIASSNKDCLINAPPRASSRENPSAYLLIVAGYQYALSGSGGVK